MTVRFLQIIFLLALTAGCGSPVQRENSKPVVLVSILPQTTFVNKIAGVRFSGFAAYSAWCQSNYLLPSAGSDERNCLSKSLA